MEKGPWFRFQSPRSTPIIAEAGDWHAGTECLANAGGRQCRDAARFNALLAEYIKAPEVTRRRIYIETLQHVMPAIRSKIIVDEQTRSILPLLNLDSHKGERP
jgi:regulator of protease activity HflC (stomatin/prohibitin superfamily)